MRSLLFIYFMLILSLNAFSQLKLGREKEATSLAGNNQVKALYSQEDEFSAILERDFSKPYDSSFVPTAEKDVWLKFTALNVDTFSTGYYLYAKDAYYTVYLQADTGWHIQRNGYLLPLKERDNKKRTFFLPIQLKLSEPTVIYIRLQAGNYKHSIHQPVLYTKPLYYEILNEELEYNQPGTTFSLIYISGLIMISCFILILYISIRKPVYIYYLFYLLFQLIYALLIFARTPLSFMNIALYFPVTGYVTTEGVQFLFIGFYTLFILKLDRKSTRLNSSH